MWKYANPQLRELVAYEPGKPVEDLARELGLPPGEIIKLASNENPLGPSPAARQAMIDTIDRAHFYPDGGGYYLREAVAEQLGLSMANVILGNGSNEIIEFLGHAYLQPGDEVVVAKHSFAVYRLMAQLFGAKVIDVPDPDFIADLDGMLAAITPRTKEVFIANPNNPTGTMVFQDDIDRFMERVPEHVMVVFDEAYFEFLDEPPDVLKYVRAGRNVVVLRTFPKSKDWPICASVTAWPRRKSSRCCKKRGNHSTPTASPRRAPWRGCATRCTWTRRGGSRRKDATFCSPSFSR